MDVSIRSYYGDSASAENNAKCVTIGELKLYFSYTTIIGFYHPSTGQVVRENEWGPTTGKHLNMISEKQERVPVSEFQAKLRPVLDRIQWKEEESQENQETKEAQS